MSTYSEWRREAFATENFPWGSFKEQAQRLGKVSTATRAYGAGFIASPRKHPVMLLLLSFALLGIAGDAITTYLLLQSPHFSETNAAAAGLMSAIGLTAYTLVAVFLGLIATLLLFVRGPNVIAWTLFGGGVTLVLFKLFVTANNVYAFMFHTAYMTAMGY